MYEKLAAKIVDEAGAQGVEAEHHPDYSGRGMYGKTTHAVSFQDTTDMIAVLMSLSYDHGAEGDETGFAQLVANVRGLRRDSLGNDIVVY